MKLRAMVAALVLAWGGCAGPPQPPELGPGPPPGSRASGTEERLDRAETLFAAGDASGAQEQAEALAAELLFGSAALSPSPLLQERLAVLLEQVDVVLGLEGDELLPALEPGEIPWWRPSDVSRSEVEAWKRSFLSGDARSLRLWLRRAAPYHRDIVAVLEEEQLPPELWVLTILESGMNTHARSRARAVGPWQFMSRTGRHYGLIISADRDQRRDWQASTRAASRYLAELQATFGDGLLALAAFNCGPSCVRRALARSDSGSFWDLELPRETREYVPKALALIDLVGAGDEPPFQVDPEGALQYEWVAVSYPVLVHDLARVCKLSSKQLRRLNPAWLRQTTPMDRFPVEARVPPGKGASVTSALASRDLAEATDPRVHRVQSGDSFWSISREYDVSLNELLEANSMTGKEVLHPGDLIRLPGRVHVVERGDTLWGISRQYHVSLQELMELNGMSGRETLRPGRLLRVPG